MGNVEQLQMIETYYNLSKFNGGLEGALILAGLPGKLVKMLRAYSSSVCFMSLTII